MKMQQGSASLLLPATVVLKVMLGKGSPEPRLGLPLGLLPDLCCFICSDSHQSTLPSLLQQRRERLPLFLHPRPSLLVSPSLPAHELENEASNFPVSTAHR